MRGAGPDALRNWIVLNRIVLHAEVLVLRGCDWWARICGCGGEVVTWVVFVLKEWQLSRVVREVRRMDLLRIWMDKCAMNEASAQ